MAASGGESGGLVEYGALGLCGFMVYFLCTHLTLKEKNHAEERKDIAKYMSRLSVMLGNRPCLLNDREHLDPENKE